MSIQDEQLSELRKVRDNIGHSRNAQLRVVGTIDEQIETFRLAILEFEDRIAVLRIRYEDASKSARTLTGAWLGRGMPQFIADQVTSIDQRVKHFADQIQKVESTTTQLVEQRDEFVARGKLAKAALADIEQALQQTEERIAEIRALDIVCARPR